MKALTIADELLEHQIDQILARGDLGTISRLLRDAQGLWFRLDGPQRQAMESEADVVLYGGAAGGGKTDLALGLGLTQHIRTLFVRREAAQLQPAYDRMTEVLGHREGFNSQTGIWRLPNGRQIQFGGVANAGDETKFQGNPRDLLVLDETANLLESQARFLMGWVRTTIPGQRCRTLMCSNPPTTPEGQWLLDFFAPWLRDNYPNPAKPGEIRWFATIGGKDVEVPDGRPFLPRDGKRIYDYQDQPHNPLDVVQPQSRTFVPSNISDNPFLMETGYKATLQALPEPLRSQMLYGDFKAGLEDGAWQVFPSAWVEAAMDRWQPRQLVGDMTSMGVDVSRGGRDESIIVKLYQRTVLHPDLKVQYQDIWIDELVCMPGHAVPDGPTLGTEVILHRRDQAPVHVDAIGVGTSVVDFLRTNGVQVVPVTGSEKHEGRDRSGVFRFKNYRTAMFWLLREALDPSNREFFIQLPKDDKLKAELCALTYRRLEGNVLQVIGKEKLEELLQRSTDSADSVAYAFIRTPKNVDMDDDEPTLHAYDTTDQDEDGGY